jgi:hypothetical protein
MKEDVGTQYPTGAAIPFPAMNQRGMERPGTEFQSTDTWLNQPSDWRALSAALAKVDLNRKLTDYPFPKDAKGNYVPGQAFNLADPTVNRQFQQATNDRVRLAKDIYLRLIVATGAYNPFSPAAQTDVPPTPEQLRALRWLAQLSVNIVDFIDSDDIMTAFNWASYYSPLNRVFPSAVNTFVSTDQSGTVYGTELPRVVVNEVYAEYRPVDDNEMTNDANTKFYMDVWAELYNPMAADTNADPSQGMAFLQMKDGSATGYPAYQFALGKTIAGRTDMIRSGNVLGRPDNWQQTVQGKDCVIGDYAGSGHTANWVSGRPTTEVITIGPNLGLGTAWSGKFAGQNDDGSGKFGGNDTFYVLGPVDKNGQPKPFPTVDPNNTVKRTYPLSTLARAEMSYKITGPPTSADKKPTLLLRRLANPYVKPTDQGGANPYVTMDYIDGNLFTPPPNGNLQPGLSYNAGQHKWEAWTADKEQGHFSKGRIDPYSASQTYLRDLKGYPNDQNKVIKNTPQHTFFWQNDNGTKPDDGPANGLNRPFTWLFHADRQLMSPLEILQVSGFKPYELTQKLYGNIENNKYGHRAPWYNQAARIYRVFEFLETHHRGAGNALGGRVPGIVNINTIWDEATFQALCDAQSSNHFTSQPVSAGTSDVKTIFNTMMSLRNPGGSSPFVPNANDRPFMSMATGYSPKDAQHPARATGIHDTILRGLDPSKEGTPSDNYAQRLLEVNGQHPSFQHELLNKLFNNITTRSNVFAVWVTVGFFRITDDTTLPVKLGAEIGKAENRHIRHRMFAIVDRSNLTTAVDPTSPQGSLNAPGGPPIMLKASIFRYDPQDATKTEFQIDGATFVPKKGADVAMLVGNYEGIPWRIQPGSQLMIDYSKTSLELPTQGGFGQRVIVSVPVNGLLPPDKSQSPPWPARFRAEVNPLAHGSPCMIQLPFIPPGTPSDAIPGVAINNYPGNPGPQPRFNPRAYPWVVRYFSIIH